MGACYTGDIFYFTSSVFFACIYFAGGCEVAGNSFSRKYGVVRVAGSFVPCVEPLEWGGVLH